ncbi:MAG: hypothetical protein U9R15_04785 [Chloroflexota bacterium]|nr:hypothetical protein [Chloroflexota bacterium]
MRIIRNERRIRVFSSIGQYVPLVGLAALLAGLVISYVKPEWFMLMLVSVTVGFGLSVAGGFFADRYAGPLAHHKSMAEALKYLGGRYTLLQYVLPIPHVLVEPGGCTLFVVKSQGGNVSYEDGKWKHQQRGKFFRQFAGQEAVGAPDAEAERQTRKLERWLTERLPELEIPVRAVILFVNPDVTLEADDAPVPTFLGKKVKAWLRGPGKLDPLLPATHRRLTEALGIE